MNQCFQGKIKYSFLKRYNTDKLIAKLHREVKPDVALNCKKKYLHNINCITETLKTLYF